jgi:V/A-type H+-transporting ATPase subunit F
MAKVGVIGDYDSIYGFSMLGLDICAAADRTEGAEALKRMAENGYGIIYITEAMAAELSEELQAYAAKVTPAIILIPGVSGNTGAGIAGVKKSVERAVGSDILFSQEPAGQ